MSALFSKTSEWRAAVPGAALAVVLAVAAHVVAKESIPFTAGKAVPVLSPVMIGILLGMMWRQFIGLPPQTESGVQWMMETLLRVGIAMVGLRLTLHGIASAGVIAVPVVLTCIVTTLLVSRWVGGALNVPASLRRLLAVGTAVCGCTAIIATAASTRARPQETSIALTCVVMIGSVGMLLYPWIAHGVFDGATLPAGIFLGSAIHDTSQVVGASLIYSQLFGSPDVVAIASATKLFRNLSIVVLIPFMAWSAAHDPAVRQEGAEIDRARPIPTFVIAFMALVVLRALGDELLTGDHDRLWQQALAACHFMSELLLICGMTALGLTVSFCDVFRIGRYALVLALIVAGTTALCSLGLTYALLRLSA